MEKRIAQLEKIIQRQQFIEDRYEELMLSARRCWRYYGADQELFTASMKAMDFLIRRHATEIDEMNEEDNDDRPDNLPSNALGQEPCAAVCARSPGPEGYTSGTTEKE